MNDKKLRLNLHLKKCNKKTILRKLEPSSNNSYSCLLKEPPKLALNKNSNESDDYEEILTELSKKLNYNFMPNKNTLHRCSLMLTKSKLLEIDSLNDIYQQQNKFKRTFFKLPYLQSKCHRENNTKSFSNINKFLPNYTYQKQYEKVYGWKSSSMSSLGIGNNAICNRSNEEKLSICKFHRKSVKLSIQKNTKKSKVFHNWLEIIAKKEIINSKSKGNTRKYNLNEKGNNGFKIEIKIKRRHN